MTEMMTGYVYRPGGKLLIKFIPCPSCGKPHEVTVTEIGFERWADGIASLEEAFPELPIAERELFLSAIDGECFAKMRREAEEEEER